MRIVKVLLAGFGALLALVIVLVAIVAFTFDPNDYKGVVTDAFTARTGRALVIDEDLRLAYFPWLAVETGGVTIGSSPAFGGAAQTFATARGVKASVKLLPLLSRRIEIGTVELDGVTVNLARDAALRGNWEDLLEASESAAPAEPPEPSGGVERLAIEGVLITDGNVYWRENTDELRYSVTGLTVATGGIGSGEPVEFEAALRFKDEVSQLTAALALEAVVAVAAEGAITATDLDTSVTVEDGGGKLPRSFAATATRVSFDRTAQTLAVDGLATDVAGIRATWQLEGTTVVDNPVIAGSVNVAPSELAPVLEQLELEPPQGITAEDLGAIALRTNFEFRAEPQSIRWSGLEAELLGMQLRGAGSLTGGNELAGTLEIPEFAPNAALQSWLRTAVPPSVDVSALDRLALRTSFDTSLDSGRASLRDLQASVLGATLTGNVEAVPGERGNVFRATIATSRFAPDAFVKAFAAMLPPNLAASELGAIELSTRVELDTAADVVTVAPFSAELFGLRASGEVTGRNVGTAATWIGSAKVAEFSPQALLQRFGLPPQPTSDSQAFTRATLDTRFAIDGDSAELGDVTLVLDDTTIKGNFTLASFEQPAYRFSLDVDRVDADRYLPPKARDAEAGEATAGDIELPQNNTMNLDGTMRVGALKLAGMDFQEVTSRIVIGGGNLKLENASAQLYGGTFAGNFHVRAAGDEPGLALDGRAASLSLEPLITALTGEPANVSGTGSFDLNLAGSGRTVIANVQTAAGNVSFDMTDGAIKGFNLGHALCSAYNATQRAPAPPEQAAQTSYVGIKGSAVVTAGTAQSNDLLARTSFMDINGAGSLHLVEQQLDYELDAKLTAPIAIENCSTLDEFIGGELPFTVRGKVTSPTILPDFSKLVRQQLREELQDRLQDRIQDRLRDLLR
jgi:AsmA protein